MNELVTIPFTDKTHTKASALRLVALLAVENGAGGQGKAKRYQEQNSHATTTSGMPTAVPRAKTSEICRAFSGYNAARLSRSRTNPTFLRWSRI